MTNISDDSACNLNDEYCIGGYTLFCFNLTLDKCNGYHFHKSKTGTIGSEILFFKPLKEVITVLCYTAFESVIAITKEWNILRHWTLKFH